jgi:hypothetical protein
VAITAPCVWDADIAQHARQLACWAGPAAAVVKVLVHATRTTADVITQAREGRAWWALAVLGTWLNSWGNRVSQVPNTHPKYFLYPVNPAF